MCWHGVADCVGAGVSVATGGDTGLAEPRVDGGLIFIVSGTSGYEPFAISRERLRTVRTAPTVTEQDGFVEALCLNP